MKRRPLISALEPRLLFDGAAVATAVDVLDNSSFESNSLKDSVDELPAIQNDSENQKKEIAFIDSNIKNYETILKDLNENINISEIYIIDSNSNGLEQIASILESKSDLDALHIISHGSEGEIRIGSSLLNSSNIEQSSLLLKSISNSMTEEGDILLYGCNVGTNGIGESFVNTFAELTRADVAASDDITGSESFNGDWDLEYTNGQIETDEINSSWDGELAINLSHSTSSFNYTENTTITLNTGIDISGFAANPEIAKISIIGNHESTDELVYSKYSTVTGTYNSSSGVLTLNDTSNPGLTNWENAINSVKFKSNSDDPSTAQRTLKIEVSGSGSGYDSYTFTINVTAINDAPTGTDRTLTIVEDTSKVLYASVFGFNDVDSADSLERVRILSQATNGILQFYDETSSTWQDITAPKVIYRADIDAGYLRFVPNSGEYGDNYATFDFKVHDGHTLSADANTITFDVNINNAPTIENTIPTQTLDEDFADYTIDLKNYFADDYTNDANLTFNVSGNTNIGVSITNGVATISSSANWNGSETLTFSAVDEQGETVSQNVLFSVNPINDTPSVETNIPTQNLDEDFADYTIDLTPYFKDIETSDANLTFSVSGNTNVGVTIANGVATISSTENWFGTETITFSATDEGGEKVSQTVDFIVSSINDTPTVEATIPAQDLEINFADYIIDLKNYFEDVESNDATLSFTYSGNTNIGVSIIDGVATISNNVADWIGNETITFTATDASGLTISQDVVFTTSAINYAPKFADNNPTGGSNSSNVSSATKQIFDNAGFENALTGWTTNGTATSVSGTHAISFGASPSMQMTDEVKAILGDSNQMTWLISPYENSMAKLEATGSYSEFNDNFKTDMGVTDETVNYIKDTFYETSNKKPTNMAYISKTFNATAGDVYQVAWNYVSGDYVPWNDGSVLTFANNNDSTKTAVLDGIKAEVTILGATNPGTGNYTTASYGSTGWQTTTIEVLETGTYTLGISVFNLGDTALNPYLLIDNIAGTTTLNGQNFDPLDKDENAPTPAGDTVLVKSGLEETDSKLTENNTIMLSDANVTDEVTVDVSSVIATQKDSDANIMSSSPSLPDNATLLSMLSVTPDSPAIDNSETTKQLTWNFDSGTEAFDFLAEGESLTLTYTLTATDTQGATDTQEITLLIEGTNDAPTITVVDASGSVTEGGILNDTGSITFEDLDFTDRPVSEQVMKSIVSSDVTLSDAQKAQIEAGFSISNGTNTNTGTVNWNYTIANDKISFLGAGETITATFTISVTDEQGKSTQQDVVITINGANTAPILQPLATIYYSDTDGVDSFEDQGSTAIASDVDENAVLTFGIDGGVDGGANVTKALTYGTLSIDKNTGEYIFTPDANNINALSADTTETVTISVTDDNGAISTQVLTIDIQSVNDTPLLNNDNNPNATFTENGAAVQIAPDITINDADSASYNGGYISFSFTANSESSDSFTIKNISGITVNGSDVYYKAVIIGTIDSSYDGTKANDLRINLNDKANITNVEALAQAISFLNDKDDLSGTSRDISILVNDGGDGGNTTPKFSKLDVTIDIVTINDIPEISLSTTNYEVEKIIGVNDNGTLQLDKISVSDADDTNLTVVFETTEYGLLTFKEDVVGGLSSNDISGNGTQSVTLTGTIEQINTTLADANGLTYVAGAGNDAVSPGLDYLKVTATDAIGAESIATKSVMVLPAVPNADSDNIVGDEDTQIEIDLVPLIHDINDNAGSYVLGTGTPDITDANGNIITNGSLSPFSGNEITNSNSEVIGYTLPNGTLSLNYGIIGEDEGVFTFTPNENWSGNESFVYQYTSGDGTKSYIAQISIFVAADNDTPVITVPNTQTVNEDTQLVFNSSNSNLITLADIDAGIEDVEVTLSVTNGVITLAQDTGLVYTEGVNNSSKMSIKGSLTEIQAAIDGLKYQGNKNYFGNDTLSISLNDLGNSGNGGALSDTKTIDITVLSVNNAPIAVDDVKTTTEDTAVTLTKDDIVSSNDTDVESDNLTITAVGNANNGTVILNNDGTITFTPTQNFNGEASFEYTISDGNGGSDTATVTVNVTAVNDVPIAVDDVKTTTEDTAITLTKSDIVDANDTDLDADALTITSVGNANNGTVILNNDGTITFTPTQNFNGEASFEYTISDGNGGSGTATVTVNVTAENDAPIAGDDEKTTTEDTAVTLTKDDIVTPNDTDVESDTLTITAVGNASNGTVILNNDGTITFTPTQNFNGEASFEYTVSDGNGGSGTATVIVNVVKDAPDAVDSFKTITEDTAIILSKADIVGINDTDKLDNLTITSVGNASNGTVILNNDGTITFTPTENFNGEASFEYTISDENGESDTATVTVNVIAVNDEPTNEAIILEQNLNENFDAYTIDLKDYFADVETSDDNFIFTISGNTNIKVTINNTIATISSTQDWNGIETITFTAIDEGGNLVSQDVKFIVDPINDLPLETPPFKSTESNDDKVDNTDNNNNDTDLGFDNENPTDLNDAIKNPFGTKTMEVKSDVNGGDNPLDIQNKREEKPTTNLKNAEVNSTTNKRVQGEKELVAQIGLKANDEGKVSFDKATIESFNYIGMKIEDMSIKNDFIEIKIADTKSGQTYEVTKMDGTPLPSGLTFDPKTGALLGEVSKDIKVLKISIKAIDSDGTSRILNIEIDLEKLRKGKLENEPLSKSFQTFQEQLIIEVNNESYGSNLNALFV